jgi:hypothetical protein
VRLLICHDCQSIEQIPDYDGPLIEAEVPRPDGTLGTAMVPPMGADVYLDHITEPHAKKEHSGNLVSVEQKDWDNPETREEIIKQIKGASSRGATGMDPEVYALRDTLREGALKCFSKHGRPKGGCIDWEDRSKRIGNTLLSQEERSAAKKRGLRLRDKEAFLCHHCPVSANYVQRKKFEKRGLYN